MSIEAARGIGDEAATAMDAAIQALMKRASARMAAEVITLDIGPDGKITQTVENVQRVNGILDRMRASLFDEEYVSAVAMYVKGLNEVSGAVSSGLREFGADEDLIRAIARRSKLATASALLSPDSFRGMFGGISAQLINGIATNASAAAVQEGVRAAILE